MKTLKLKFENINELISYVAGLEQRIAHLEQQVSQVPNLLKRNEFLEHEFSKVQRQLKHLNQQSVISKTMKK